MSWKNILKKDEEITYPPYRYKFNPDKYKKWRKEQLESESEEE